MWKYIFIFAIIIGIWWYIAPDHLNSTIANIKDRIGFNKQTPEPQPETTITETTTTEPVSQGYCVVEEECVYVSESQCLTTLFGSRSECMDSLGTIETTTTESNRNYVGFPRDEDSRIYDCNTDSDCQFDNPACDGELCQCDYSTGECYII